MSIKSDLTASKQIFKTIDEIAEKIIDYRGKTPPKAKKGIKLITAKVIKDGSIVDGNHEYISQDTYDQWMTRGFPQKGDVLFTTEAPLGEVAILQSSERIALAQRVVLLRGKPALVDQTYLMYALKSSFVQRQLRERSASTTVEGIKQSELRQVRIPLPPLEEQKRIAEITRKCDRIRRTRRYTQQLSDTYLQSVFLEMFAGAESKSWNRVKVEEVVDRRKNSIRTGPFGSQLLHEEFQERGEIAVLGIDNVVQNYFAWNKPRFITREKYKQLKRYTVYPGDVLVTIMGTCGRCAVVPGNIPLAINTKHLCCITLDQTKCFPIYLKHFFLGHPLALDQLGISERGAVMPGLNMSLIKDLEMTLPPLDLQEKFAKIVQHYNLIDKKRREAERQAEHLFQTILHSAFRGEL